MTLLARLVEVSERVGASSARLAKARELADFLRSLEPAEIAIGVLYLAGELPQGRFGIGYSTLRAASEAVAATTPSLSIIETDRRLSEIATIRGTGSSARRAQALRDLFALATPEEHEFLIRLLVGELRQGALAGVMVDAIAAATSLPLAEVRRAAMYEKSLGLLARTGFERGVAGLREFQLQVMTPVAPMLAQTAAEVDEALEMLSGDLAFEWKMDGARIQVHKQGDLVRIYTRSLNEVTSAIPEIVAAAQSYLRTRWSSMARRSR